MKRKQGWKFALVSVACLGMLLPGSLLQAAGPPQDASVAPQDARPAPARQTGVVVDLKLQKDDVLLGQVVRPDGKPAAGLQVTLHSAGREIARSTTEKTGYFAFRDVRAGVYQLTTDQSQAACRVWSAATAPPAAQPGVLMVTGGRQVLGQEGPLAFWLGNPWVIAGLTATAIAIPIAIHNSRMHRTASD